MSGRQGQPDDDLAAVSALLVEDRVLRRIIKAHRQVAGLGLQVPHATAYGLPRADLTPLVTAGERAIELERLPERVIVLSGDRAALERGSPVAWTAAWRAIFHAGVHEAFDRRIAGGALTAATVRERINEIGQIEFDEIRLVLRQEDLLLPPVDDVSTYVEFAALFLELRHFAPHTLADTFPTFGDTAHIDALIARDLDDAVLLAAARPNRAPATPLVDAPAAARGPSRPAPAGPTAPVSAFTIRLAIRGASSARAQGNHARAAILAARAGDHAACRADLEALTTRLGRVLNCEAPAAWVDALVPVARAAAAERLLRYTAAARLLLDLQAGCVDAERDVEVVDAITWMRTFGRQSIVRRLPATREIRVARRMRAANRKVVGCDLASADERERLGVAVRAMAARANANVRTVLRPTIEAAFAEVELFPRHLPERVAQKKMVDELLDRAVEVGRLSLGDLRDAIAHNELKLSSLRPAQLVTGDQLLRVDRMLSRSLEGVYRRGEIYLRFLQKVSSVLSGNQPGRLLTLYILLPLVGSFFVVEGLHHMVVPAANALGYIPPDLATRPAFIGVGLLVFLLLHAAWFRSVCGAVVGALGRAFRATVGGIARVVARIPYIRPLTRWVLVPAIPALLAALLIHGPPRWPVAGALYVAGALLLSSRSAEEIMSDWLVRSGRHLTHRIFPGLVRYALELFAWLIELVERGIYRVDERLRFRPNQSTLRAVITGVLGTVWFLISYVLRIYVNLLIEPTVNPIKHFPVVTVAAKLILPILPQLVIAIASPFEGVLGPTLATSFASFTVLVLPGIAGFLAWELNGNWKLYAHNRREHLRQVSFGSHGETMTALLRLGFHSGTVPKLHARLRRATWAGNVRVISRCREGLHHVEEAVSKLVSRQLAAMLNQDLTFQAADVSVGHVEVGSNRLRIELHCPSVSPEAALLCFEEQSGWLVASIPTPGWIAALDSGQRRTLEVALTGFYKMAGVELVREQLEAVLTPAGAPPPPYDVADDGLVVWPGPGFDVELIYDLGSPASPPRVRGGTFAGPLPSFAGRAAVFGREPVRWRTWATAWERLSFGMDPPPLVGGPSVLPAAAPQ